MVGQRDAESFASRIHLIAMAVSSAVAAVSTQAASRLTGPRLTGQAMVVCRIKLGKTNHDPDRNSA
ncbi:protein of unknown function [Pararobbsia alpina]